MQAGRAVVKAGAAMRCNAIRCNATQRNAVQCSAAPEKHTKLKHAESDTRLPFLPSACSARSSNVSVGFPDNAAMRCVCKMFLVSTSSNGQSIASPVTIKMAIDEAAMPALANEHGSTKQPGLPHHPSRRSMVERGGAWCSSWSEMRCGVNSIQAAPPTLCIPVRKRGELKLT